MERAANPSQYESYNEVQDKFNTGETYNADLMPEYYASPSQEVKKTTSHPLSQERSFKYEQVSQETLTNMKAQSKMAASNMRN